MPTHNSISSFVARIWANVDPAEGSSLWADLETGWQTTDRRTAVEWVRANARPLTHYWALPK